MRLSSVLLVAAAAAAALPARAQSPDSTVRLDVTLDRADWHYAVGDTAEFRVSLRRGGRAVPGAHIVVAMGPERMAPDVVDTVGAAGAPAYRNVATMRKPGFYRLTASADVAGVRYTALATAAFSPECILPTTEMPPDFMAFWTGAVAEARRIPLNPVLTPMPERSTADVDVFHVNFQNHRANSRLYGILTMPKAPGRYPAILAVPGAGVRPYYPSIGTARRGVIHLAIGIHGIPVDRDSLFYNELRWTALEHYRTAGLEDRHSYYFKRVFVGLVRAGDLIASLPSFDGHNYAVQGGSQGGGLAIVAAALDPRVKAIAVSYPAMADHWGYLEGRAGGWPHALEAAYRVKALPEKMATLRYYDAANFARYVRVPGLYAWGFNDTVVPPTSMYAAYNVIAGPKEVLVAKENGHFRVEWQSRRMDAWLLERLGVR